jgi:hypothetical protein
MVESFSERASGTSSERPERLDRDMVGSLCFLVSSTRVDVVCFGRLRSGFALCCVAMYGRENVHLPYILTTYIRFQFCLWTRLSVSLSHLAVPSNLWRKGDSQDWELQSDEDKVAGTKSTLELDMSWLVVKP